jgi:hypothetical protein
MTFFKVKYHLWFDAGECPLHPGERDVGDAGLAHCVVGWLGISQGDGGATEIDTERFAHVGGHGVIDAFANSAKKHARSPWLLPKH